MEKILGIDLGTNSIGWAIRNLSNNGNQIVDKGVLTFDKGVGMNSSGNEEPKVKKRTESRGKRRSYQAKKYRKAELLKLLIENKMCPLSPEELKDWSVGQWVSQDGKSKNLGRIYPTSTEFINWTRFDFNGDGKPDYQQFGLSNDENCYVFRMLAISENSEHKSLFKNEPALLGRVLYQMVQQRGFKGKDEEEAKTMLEGSDKAGTKGRNEIESLISEHKTLGAALYYVNKERGERIRKRYNLRSDLEAELKEICKVQGLDEEFYRRAYRAIIWQRPLRSQKGLVGICTFERNKSRCPVSHPLYEEYRTWVFINNLKIVPKEGIDKEVFLKDVVYPMFSKKADDFELSEIVKELKKHGAEMTARFPYGQKLANGKVAEDTKVLTNRLQYRFKNLFGEDWRAQLGWVEMLENKAKPENCKYSAEDLWHLLFTADKEYLAKLGKEVLFQADPNKEEKGEVFSKIKFPQGYATLSVSAIRKLLPYLRMGFLYSEAVYLANMHKLLGMKELTAEFLHRFKEEFKTLNELQQERKTVLGVVNGLIARQVQGENRYYIEDCRQLDESEQNEVEEAFAETFGEESWAKFSEAERERKIEKAAELYREFLMKPRSGKNANLYFKIPRLHDLVFQWLQAAYGVPEANFKYLWHPSEQESYPDAKVCRKYLLDGRYVYIPENKAEGFIKKHPEAEWQGNTVRQLGEPQPISRGFKNPMAMKTLHKLKQLVNYLIQVEKVDEETKVVVEIARELNDANRRKAIERWQNLRKAANEKIVKRLEEYKAEYNLDIDTSNKRLIDKYRLWEEQSYKCLYTGNPIEVQDLFRGNRFDLEHTIPASLSFDNELKNLTLADITYNRQVKGTLLPTSLPNYEMPKNGYRAIRPNIDYIEKEVERLEALLKAAYKKKSDIKEVHNEIIQKRHMLKMDLEYWRYKLQSFTITEFKAGWRNSQLRDTQIITKYALPYLKSLFRKTEVQKGTVTSAFREIYRISPRQAQKDRTKHSHHAIDAAVLTTIPPPVIRDQILKEYNILKDQDINATYHEDPRYWPGYKPEHILSIENTVLINYLPDRRTLVQTRKVVRKRGRIQYLKEKNQTGKWVYKLDSEGKKIKLVTQGDTIRGALHSESTFGAIKQPIRENGKILFDDQHNMVLGEEKWIVMRRPLKFKNKPDAPGFKTLDEIDKAIVDRPVFELIRKAVEEKGFQQALDEGIWMIRAKDKNGKKMGEKVNQIKSIRCRKPSGKGGFLKFETAIAVSNQSFVSAHEYKNQTYSEKDDNIFCLYYQGSFNGKEFREFKIVDRKLLVDRRIRAKSQFFKLPEFSRLRVGKGANQKDLLLCFVLEKGTKCLFFEKHKDEIETLNDPKNNEQLGKRLFQVFKFNLQRTPYLFLQRHIEARSTVGEDEQATEFKLSNNSARLMLKSDKFRCLIEGLDFAVEMDGSLIPLDE